MVMKVQQNSLPNGVMIPGRQCLENVMFFLRTRDLLYQKKYQNRPPDKIVTKLGKLVIHISFKTVSNIEFVCRCYATGKC